MTEIRTIVCPVDRSDVSRRALGSAVTLAAAHGAVLHVVEVVDSVFPPVADASAVLHVQDEARLALQEDLNWFVAPLLRDDVKAEVHLREGRVVAEILRLTAEFPAPLIVMGTHGRGGFEQLVLGSVTERVVRKAPCPVLAVPPAAMDAEPLTLRRIVCAVDFSDASAAALEMGHLVGRPAAANLLLLHVLEWPFGDAEGPEPIMTLRANLEAEAKAQLDGLATAAQARVSERVVRVGKPLREIPAFARDRSADLIVLGASGRGAINQAILGSTAHAVLRDAPCPVLTVPVAATSS